MLHTKKFAKSIIKLDADYHINTQFWASKINTRKNSFDFCGLRSIMVV